MTDWDFVYISDVIRDEAPSDDDALYCAEQYCRAVREGASALLKMRLNKETGKAVAKQEAELLSALAVIQLICSELRESRVVVPFRQGMN